MVSLLTAYFIMLSQRKTQQASAREGRDDSVSSRQISESHKNIHNNTMMEE
jgi:hypothetical protein